MLRPCCIKLPLLSKSAEIGDHGIATQWGNDLAPLSPID